MKENSVRYVKILGLLIALFISGLACNLPFLPAPSDQSIGLTEEAHAIRLLTEQAGDQAAGETAEAQAIRLLTEQAGDQAAGETAEAQAAQSATNPTNTPIPDQQPTSTSPAQPAPTQPPQPTQPPPPTSPPPPSITSSYVELYDEDGVDLDNSGGSDEMVYLAYDSTDLNPGHAIGQKDGGGTVWASWGGTPTYEDCRSITRWETGVFIAQGDIFCYGTDQGNYGYLRIDRLEQIGTGDSEIQPWVLGVSFTTWVP